MLKTDCTMIFATKKQNSIQNFIMFARKNLKPPSLMVRNFWVIFAMGNVKILWTENEIHEICSKFCHKNSHTLLEFTKKKLALVFDSISKRYFFSFNVLSAFPIKCSVRKLLRCILPTKITVTYNEKNESKSFWCCVKFVITRCDVSICILPPNE